MITVKLPKKDPRCGKHNTPVVITIPLREFGNAHGERWFCKECNGEPDKIVVRVINN